MPVKPLPLRFLRSPLLSTRFSTMTLNPTRQPSSAVPVFSRIFPLKLKYAALGFPPKRAFSTRPFRPRPDSGPKPVRALPKSLIEDEYELDDWVNKLRTSSLRSGVLTEDEEEEEGKKRGRMKRGRESNFTSDDDDGGGGGGEGFRKSYSSGAGLGNSSRFGRRFGSEFEGNEDDEGRNSRRGQGGMRGGVKGRDREFGERNVPGRGPRGGGRIGRGENGGGRRVAEEGVRSVRGRGTRGGGRIGRGENGGGRGVAFASEEEGARSVRGRGTREAGRLGRGENGGGRRVAFASEEEGRSVRGRGPRGGGRLGRGENGVGRRVAFASEEEEEEEEDEGYGLREEKSVSDFIDLIDDEDSEEDPSDESEEDESRSRASLFPNEVKKQILAGSSPGGESYLSETRFDQCAVSPLSLKAIKDVGYEKMTVVQEATLPLILKGKDVMAKARTGTGKTVAFLLPSIEIVINSPPAGRDQKRPPILVLVVCPTRELASQAAAEANTLLKYHPSTGVQVVMGGTRLAVEQKRMQANPCQILVATPGRLRDHLENTAGFATRLMGVKVLVLDEADHLLDMGFRKDIERIVAAVPKQRQTLLFSATIPDEVRQICHIALKRDHEFVNTVQEGTGETHSQVRQMHLVAPLENHFSLVYAILKEHISDDVNYKVLVFCTTAMVTRLVADLLGELNLNVREIHSRKPQSYRTRVSDEFRKSKGLILVTSDVSARGVDYPDVTLVIQMGLPSDREQYIHRLGRTGRKGKEGQGILLLAPWEEFFLNCVKELPITKAPMPMVDPDTRKKVERALSHVEMKSKEAAYQAWLGYYNSNKTVARDKHRLVELANEFSRSMGLDTPPAIPKLVLGKMGLKNVPGLRTK